MYTAILTRLRTVEDVSKLKSELSLLSDSLFRNSRQGFESALSSDVRSWVADSIRDDIKGESDDLEKYIKEFQKKLDEIDEVEMTLAFEPTDLSLDKFHKFLVDYVGISTVFKINYDPRILGGATLSYKGVYRDFSLKKIVDLEFENNKNYIIGLLQK